MSEIFRRVEKKYILDKKQYNKLMLTINKYLEPDEYGKSTICNIYFDTNNYDLISHSIEKPYHKEKIRLRSYNVPDFKSKVYLEIKRKTDGIVGKRRIEMELLEFNNYMRNISLVKNKNMQIKKELDYYFKKYNLEKKMYISYDRDAYYDKNDKDFRVTIDSNILARQYNLDLDKGVYGINILDPEKYVMEIKTLGAIPIWFVKVLNEFKISPCGFSKYGEAYTQLVLKANNYESIVV